MKKYQYILLDWDGNLAKTLDIWLDALRAVLEKRGIYKTDEEIGSSFGQFLKFMEDWGVSDIDAAFTEADNIAKEKLPGAELYPDALEVLETLHENGHKLALITTSPRDNVIGLLHHHAMHHLFDVVITGDDVTNHKPHPESLEMGLQKLSGDTAHAVMIGDSDKDLGAALNAGIDSILFYPAEHKKFYNLETLKTLQPTHIVSDFRKIIELVDQPEYKPGD